MSRILSQSQFHWTKEGLLTDYRETTNAVLVRSTGTRDDEGRGRPQGPRATRRFATVGLVLVVLCVSGRSGPVHAAAREASPTMNDAMPTTKQRLPESTDGPAPAVARQDQSDAPRRPAVARRHKLVGDLFWHVDYTAAYREAERRQRQLLIVFQSEREAETARRYERAVLASSELTTPLAKFVRVILPCDARLPGDPSRRLLDARAFRHLNGRPGLAVIDFLQPGDRLYGRVVSAHPFARNDHYGLRETRTVLNLPRGTATQRALVYAVRMHPARPDSADGESSRVLFRGASSHSQTMVDYGQIGHFGWGRRSRTLENRLGNGLSVQEVAAVTWSAGSLIGAAHDCVEAWRSSPAHWSTVVRDSARYGYDMRQAGDGAWYATGLVATRR